MPVLRLLLSRPMGAFFSTLALVAFASTGHALTVTLNATDSGWHNDNGNHTFTNENYTAGWSNDEFRNFFVFDLSALPGGETILSATLRAYNPAVGEPDVTYDGGYTSSDASETYLLHEVLATSAVVTAPTVSNTTVYDDLGDGPVFGSTSVSAADNGQDIDVSLNGDGLGQLTTLYLLGADIVLGGRLSTLTSAFGTEETVWGNTDPPNNNQGSPYDRQLIVVMTPEPGTAVLMGLGLAGIAAGGRRQQGGRA